MRLQDKLIHSANNLCLAICYLYAAYDSQAEKEEKNVLFVETAVMAALLQILENTDILDKDGFVKNAEALMNSTGTKWRVSKKRIDSIQELPNGYAVVNFEYNKHNHWVLFKDKRFLYNSLEESQCFKYGKPTDARILEKVK